MKFYNLCMDRKDLSHFMAYGSAKVPEDDFVGETSENRSASEKFAQKRKPNLPAWVVKPLGEMARPISELSDEELYQKCREYGQNAKEWSRKFAALLPEVARRGLHRRKRFGSIQEFAGKVAGMSEYAVDRILHLHAKIKDKPCLLRLFESGAESWSKIIKVAYVATIETDELWAEKVPQLSAGALEVLVQNYRLKSVHMNQSESKTLFGQEASGASTLGDAGFGDPGAGDGGTPFEPPVRFSFPASREVEFDLRLAKQRLEKQSKQALSWNETFQKIIEQSELAKSKILPQKVAQIVAGEEICTKCSRKKAFLRICEECSKKLGCGKGRDEAGDKNVAGHVGRGGNKNMDNEGEKTVGVEGNVTNESGIKAKEKVLEGGGGS